MNAQTPDCITSWTIIYAAADGSRPALELFAQRYQQTVRNTLAARWKGSRRIAQIEDAVQDVFIECIRPGGALSKVNPGHPSGFRGYLYGVIRNVMLRFESRRPPELAELPEVTADEITVSGVFDREYAQAVLKEASLRQRHNAESLGDNAVRRVELLQLRFHEGLPLRDIAKRWSVESAWLQRQYARARDEFLNALLEVVAASQPSATDAENILTCKELLGMLGNAP